MAHKVRVIVSDALHVAVAPLHARGVSGSVGKQEEVPSRCAPTLLADGRSLPRDRKGTAQNKEGAPGVRLDSLSSGRVA